MFALAFLVIIAMLIMAGFPDETIFTSLKPSKKH